MTSRDHPTWPGDSIAGSRQQGRHCAECSLSVDGDSDGFEVGDLIDGRYRVVKLLGSGAMGHVYRAYDVHLKRAVAIKRPRMDVPVAASLFSSEAALLARMRSSHVAAVLSFGTGNGAPYFAMEHVEGATLAHIVERHAARRSAMPLLRALSIVREIASALSEAHALSIVHCDVKPANVIVEHDTGRVVLVDFGVARDALSATALDEVFGTLEYLAPELLRGERPTPATDQFALAVLTYELVTGVLPYQGSAVELMRPQRPLPPPPSTRAPNAAPLDGAILRALAPDPQGRFPTVASFAAALRNGAARHLPAPEQSEPTGLTDVEEGALRVLVVDDDPLFVRLATRCVEIAFASVPIAISHADSGARTLETCAQRLPHLVLLDYDLPDIDGVELLTRIRTLPEGGSVRVVVVTAGVDEEAVLRFAALGVRRFARKPLEHDAAVELISEVARSSGWLSASP